MIIKAVEISCFMHIVIFADVHFFNSFCDLLWVAGELMLLIGLNLIIYPAS